MNTTSLPTLCLLQPTDLLVEQMTPKLSCLEHISIPIHFRLLDVSTWMCQKLTRNVRSLHHLHHPPQCSCSQCSPCPQKSHPYSLLSQKSESHFGSLTFFHFPSNQGHTSVVIHSSWTYLKYILYSPTPGHHDHCSLKQSKRLWTLHIYSRLSSIYSAYHKGMSGKSFWLGHFLATLLI